MEMNKVKIFFFPHIAGGHLLPMIDAARFIASHPNVQATIITTPRNAQLYQKAINRDRDGGRDISFHIMELPKAELGLPDNVENHLGSLSLEVRYKVFKAIMSLKKPLSELLIAQRPDCLVSDVVQSWTLEVANQAGIPRVAFRVTGIFPICVDDCLEKFKPHEKVSSDDEPFLVPGLPDPIFVTRKRIPLSQCDQNVVSFFDEIHQAERDSYGVIVNSAYDLEPNYHNYAKTVLGLKFWAVGPVCKPSNNNLFDKSQRGAGESVQDEDTILEWLDSKAQHSVVYMSFGSEPNFCKEQFHEIAHALEASGHPFIWVAKSCIYTDPNEEGWFPEGFEKRMRDSNQGLVIKGWAPQLLILDHVNLGAFITHCGWNSITESLCAAGTPPFITWPLAVDQFFNENLVVDVMKVGIRVGNEESSFMSTNLKLKATVTRDKIDAAVRRILSGGQEVQEMRKRAQELAEKCKKAVEEGGSSYRDVYALVDDLIARRKQISSSHQACDSVTC